MFYAVPILPDHFSLVDIYREGLISVVLCIAGWIMLFPVRTLIKSVKGKAKLLDDVHTELATQRTNCLTTLQSQGDKQIELLKTVAETLNEMRLSQSEMVGYMRGSNRG